MARDVGRGQSSVSRLALRGKVRLDCSRPMGCRGVIMGSSGGHRQADLHKKTLQTTFGIHKDTCIRRSMHASP
jgi:hypothetical protein